MSNKRPFKNCKWLKMWKMTDEDNETYAANGTAGMLDFTKRLTTYRNGVETNNTPLHGDGVKVEDAIIEGDETLELGIHHLADDERPVLYGETLNAAGASVSTGDEIPPYFCVATAAEKRNGTLNLRKWMKTVFQKHQEDVTQQESGGLTYSMPTLRGTCSQNTRMGVKSVRIEVDPRTQAGRDFIENWYANAEYIGSGMVNNCTIKQGTTALNNGDVISDDGNFTFTGGAIGGTAPYTYEFYSRTAGSDTWDNRTAVAGFAFSFPTATDVEFKMVAKDATDLTLTKTIRVTVTPSE